MFHVVDLQDVKLSVPEDTKLGKDLKSYAAKYKKEVSRNLCTSEICLYNSFKYVAKIKG